MGNSLECCGKMGNTLEMCGMREEGKEATQMSINNSKVLKSKSNNAGIGAVFGVDSTGAVFFNRSVPGSSCQDAQNHGQLMPGDVLHSVDGEAVYRAPLNVIANKLLGQNGSQCTLVFRRGEKEVTLTLERRLTDKKAAQNAVNMAKESSGMHKTP